MNRATIRRHLDFLKERRGETGCPPGHPRPDDSDHPRPRSVAGYGISQRLAVLSHDQFQINPGSLFPSLYRLEQDGKLKAEWRPTENNRRAKYYRLTASGRKHLEQHRERWNRVSVAVASVLEGA